jgi:serine/threonine protein kinase
MAGGLEEATRVIVGEQAPTLLVSDANLPTMLAPGGPFRMAPGSPQANADAATVFLDRPMAPPIAAPRPTPLADTPTVIMQPGAWQDASTAKRPALTPLPRGHRLRGKYEILKPLARGGFSFVYLARHERTGLLLAIKEACPMEGFREADGSIDADPVAMARHREMLITEIVAVARSAHPGVVKIEDAFEESGTIYLAMEYVEGEPLSQMQSRRGHLSLPTVQKLAGQLVEIVHHLHASDTLHGDIKPANVIMRPNMTPSLIDFGTALRLSDAEYDIAVATPGFSPPERWTKCTDIGPWSDIYSLGATLASTLTGACPPRDGFHPAALPLMEAGKLANGLRAALIREHTSRPQTAEAFADLLGLPKPGQGAAKPWTTACSLFISYSRQDTEIIEPLVKSLQHRGINLWIDRTNIAPGTAWAGEIARALSSARIVLVFASQNSMASRNVHNEIYLADSEKKPIVAAKLDDAPFHNDVKLFLARAQNIDARSRSSDTFVRDVTSLLNAA